MSDRLAGRVAMVTGAARGIGESIARAYAAEGATVAVLDAADGSSVAAEVGGLAFVADVRSKDEVDEAVASVVAELGSVDVLVNDAGVFRSTPLLEIEVDEWDLLMEVNARAMLLTAQAVVPGMPPGGRIVNIASMGGKLGEPGQAHYAASKAAVIALTRVAAMELGPLGINVNCICPGYVATDMGAERRTEEQVDRWLGRSPLGRLGTPADVAAMAVFLASDDSAYCTGQALNVTGGLIFH